MQAKSLNAEKLSNGEWLFVFDAGDDNDKGSGICAIKTLDPRILVYPVGLDFHFLRNNLFYFQELPPRIEFRVRISDGETHSFIVKAFIRKGEKIVLRDFYINLAPLECNRCDISELLSVLHAQSDLAFNLDTFVEPILQPFVKAPEDKPPLPESKIKASQVKAIEYLRRFLTSPAVGDFHLIASPSGTGKTTLLRYFQYAIQEPSSDIGPRAALWINEKTLVGLKKVTADTVLKTIVNYYRASLPRLDIEVLTKLLMKQQAVLLIDGLDEIVSRTGVGNLDAWLTELFAIADRWKAKILVSCRTTLLPSTAGFAQFAPRVHFIVEWTEEMMLTWLERNAHKLEPPVIAKPKEIIETIRCFKNLEKLCKVPFLLKSFAEIYASLKEARNSGTTGRSSVTDNEDSTAQALRALGWEPIDMDMEEHEIYEVLITKKLETNLKKKSIPASAGITVGILWKSMQLISLDCIAGKEACFAIESTRLVDKGMQIKLFSASEEKALHRLLKNKQDENLEFYLQNFSLIEGDLDGCNFPHRSIPEYLIADLIARNGVAYKEYFLPKYITLEGMDFLLKMLGKSRALPVVDIVHFFSIPCDPEFSNRLLEEMDTKYKARFYSKEDIFRVFTDGLNRQSDLQIPSLSFLKEYIAGSNKQNQCTFLEILFDNKDLTSLNLTLNNFVNLPESIGNLANLQALKITSNVLLKLPNSIKNLHNLRKLDIRAYMTEIPEGIGNLGKLQSLKIVSFHTVTLPASIGKLSNLLRLDITDSKLTCLPEEIGNLSNLQEVNVSNNQISALPDTFQKLSNLLHLNIYANEFREIPPVLEQLSKLQDLTISGNKVTELPDWIGDLEHLRKFDGQMNKITSIPGTFSHLKQLLRLDLRNNLITKLPENIVALNLLNSFDYTGNPLQPFTESQERWLKDLAREGCEINQISDWDPW